MKKNKPTWNDIDNIYEAIGYFFYMFKNNFFKFMALFIVIFLIVGGFTCDFKNLIFTKEPVNLKDMKHE